MFGKKVKTPSIDVERVVAAAVEAAFGENGSDRHSAVTRSDSDGGHNHRFGQVAAVATGALVATAARAAYKRARDLDLERVAELAEKRLRGSSD
jgi:ADP-ribosylglycohydrolase